MGMSLASIAENYMYQRTDFCGKEIYCGYKHFTLIDEKTSLPLSVRGAYKATTAPYQIIWCSNFSLFIHFPGCLRPGSSGSPGGSDSPGYLSPDHPHPGSATLLSPRIIDSIPRQSAQARILATDATCSGYKHFTLIDEKMSLPLSVRGAYKATTAPYQTIWFSNFSLFIHFPRVSPAR